MSWNMPDGVTDADCEPRRALTAMEQEDACSAAQSETEAQEWLQTVEEALDAHENGTDEEPGKWTCPVCDMAGNVGDSCAACGENLYTLLNEARASKEAARCGAA